MIPCDVTTSRTRVYKRRQLKGVKTLEFRLQCELSAIKSSVTVIISDLLTVRVAKSESAVTLITSELKSVCGENLLKSCCSRYLCNLFS
ncbi:hypothetical protein AVEN_33443-1 [Araneus ventricosus]|uniref:Uncharacterized protein n=1 Tax=Araneus ventricosus TaxID=182803 RepID=A0A4Y2UX77_ARAVE|nr:hypothetical protein AVEN_43856-1 [Araneus ventricosus]GBO17018.1 hypothetical protein AVEN_33443-1 [Araneus ventricosus]